MVKWSQLRDWSRFFSFGHGDNRVLVINSSGNNVTLGIDQS